MTTLSKWLSLAILLSAVSVSQASAATSSANSCSQADVQAAINSAHDGDTVVIPNGTCTWNAGISTTKQIEIQGQARGSVKLVMGGSIQGQGSSLFTLTTGNSFSTEVSNLEFWPGSGTGQYLIFNGTGSKPPLIHDNYFNVPDFQIFNTITLLRSGGGIIYKNTFESTNVRQCNPGLGGYSCGSNSGNIQIKDPNGAPSWSTPSTMGTADTSGLNNVYIEDNTFTNTGQTVDCDDGARVVIRHNTFNDTGFICHGADTSAIGSRHVELYSNTFVFHSTGSFTLHDMNGNPVTGQYPLNINRWWDVRGGTGIVTGNVMPDISSQAWGNKPELTLHIEQIDRNAGPDACCPKGYPCFHQVGRGQNNSSEPMYIWNNSGSGAPQSPGIENSGYGQCGGNTNPNNFIQAGRDFIAGSAKPGWSPYTYPHPLRNGSSASGPNAPTGVQAVAR